MKFPVPTEGTAWASGGISGKVKMFARRRRRSGGSRFLQKKDMTSWAFVNGLGTTRFDDDPIAITGGGAVNRIVTLTPSSGRGTVADTQIYSATSGKIVRFDGEIRVAMAANYEAGTEQSRNAASILYMWMKNKLGADQLAGNIQNPAATMFDPMDDWAPLMMRRDIIKWGVVDCYGPVLADQSAIPVVTQLPAPGAAAHASFAADIIANSRHTIIPNVCRIPFPRMGGKGIRLQQGESLDLVVHGFYFGQTITETIRELWAYPRFRVLWAP